MLRSTALILAVAIVAAGTLCAQQSGLATKDPGPEVGIKVGNEIPGFKTKAFDLGADQEVVRDFDSQRTERPTAYVFVSQTCPYVKKYRGRIRDIAKTYGKKGVDFVLVYPLRKMSLESKKAYHRKNGFKALLVDDEGAAIARQLKVTKTPEVIITSKTHEIIYRGGIDDQPMAPDQVTKPHFKNALDEHLAGKPVSVTTAPLFG